jgi:metal-responsive CopG/Arc/MetJ family transcriptional regulator
METVSIRFQEEVLKRMDDLISERNFNSRTEFIREAVRDKLSELSKDELINEFLKFKGKSKNKTTYSQNLTTKEAASKEFMTELEKRFN